MQKLNRVLFFCFFFVTGILLSPLSVEAQACPNFLIEGFGRNSTGGCGGTVFTVTNLNDSGPGSLRDVINRSGARIIKFAVAGIIDLNSSLSISNNFVTIDGSDAPNGGIALRGNVLEISASHVIVRHIRVRVDKGNAGPDAIVIYGSSARHVVLDHVSTSWAGDGNIDIVDGSSDITVQWSILSENMGPGAMLIRAPTTTRITLHHNLYAQNVSLRDPAIDTGDQIDVVNNVIYRNTSYPGVIQVAPKTAPVFVNIVRNYHKAVGNTEAKSIVLFTGRKALFGDQSQVYLQGNIGPTRPNDNLPESAIAEGNIPLTTTRFNYPQVTTTSALQAYNAVLANSGATLPCRDAIDQRVVNDVINGTQSTPGAWPDLTQSCGGNQGPAAPGNLTVQ